MNITLQSITYFMCAIFSAHSAVVLTNMPVTNPIGYPVGQGEDKYALSFSTPENPFQLDSITLPLFLFDPSKATPQLSLYIGDTASPNTKLLTFITPSFEAGYSDYVFSTSTFELTANTTYWLILEDINSIAFDFNWNCSNPSVKPTGEFLYIGSYRIKGQDSSIVSLSQHLGVTISATPIPESSIGLLLLLSAVCIAMYRITLTRRCS